LDNQSDKFVLFTLNDQRIALHLSDVEKIARVVELTSMPNAPDIVMGVINVQGRIIPVVNLRKRFNLENRDIDLNDHFIIVRTTKRSMALWVDFVRDIVEIPKENIVENSSILPNLEYFEGAVKIQENIILIQDIEKFISLDEEKKLEKAITKMKDEKSGVPIKKKESTHV
jgi:purine-binding chemotaxis protein CheW